MLGRQFTLEKQSIHELFVNTTKQHNSEASLPFLKDTSFVSSVTKMESRALFRENSPCNDGQSAGIPPSLSSVGQIAVVVSQSGLSPTPWVRFLFGNRSFLVISKSYFL